MEKPDLSLKILVMRVGRAYSDVDDWTGYLGRVYRTAITAHIMDTGRHVSGAGWALLADGSPFSLFTLQQHSNTSIQPSALA